MDSKKSGTITYEELKSGLLRLGYSLSEAEVQSLIKAVCLALYLVLFLSFMSRDLLKLLGFAAYRLNLQADVNGDGTIDYNVFIAAMIQRKKLDNDEHLYKAFQQLDIDNSGSVT